MRTPLSGVIGFAEILTHSLFGSLNSRQLDYAQGIVDSANQVMALINDVLDLAMIESGDLVLQRGQVDIGELVHAVANLTRWRAEGRGLHLVVDCPPDIGEVMADPMRLRQIVLNLLGNACKFTEGGEVRLAVE